jgi:hypothetical protein
VPSRRGREDPGPSALGPDSQGECPKTILVLSDVTKTILVVSGVRTWEAAERFLPPSQIVDRWLAWSTGLA